MSTIVGEYIDYSIDFIRNFVVTNTPKILQAATPIFRDGLGLAVRVTEVGMGLICFEMASRYYRDGQKEQRNDHDSRALADLVIATSWVAAGVFVILDGLSGYGYHALNQKVFGRKGSAP